MNNIANETKQRVYKTFNKTEEMVDEDVETITKWLETRHHLPEVMDECKIRNMLNLCKFNLEKTKQKIDNYYSIRSKYPDLFKESNPKLPHLQNAMELTHISNHPQLVDGVHRVSFLRPKEPNTLDPKSVGKLCFALLEMRLQEDFMVDDIAVFDMANVTFRDIIKLTLPITYKIFNTYKEIYSLRLHAVYNINSPSYVSLFMRVMQFILPAKIFKKVKVCSDAEILKEVLPLKDLPKDYGDTGPSLDELNELSRKRFVKFQDRFDLLDRMRVDESLRPKK